MFTQSIFILLVRSVTQSFTSDTNRRRALDTVLYCMDTHVLDIDQLNRCRVCRLLANSPTARHQRITPLAGGDGEAFFKSPEGIPRLPRPPQPTSQTKDASFVG